MTTVIKTVTIDGAESEVRVEEDAKKVSGYLAVARKEKQPFVVFTNAETGKQESFDPDAVASFAEA